MIFFLALDGLDYDAVVDWQLSNLLQTQHGKLKVPLSFIASVKGNVKDGKLNTETKNKFIPLSPSVWATFLTGRWIRDYGIHFTPHPHWGTLETPTFTSFFKNTYMYNVPYVNYDYAVPLLTHLWSRGSFTLEQLHRILRMLYNHYKTLLVELLPKYVNSDMCIAYFHFPDCLEHLSKKRSDLQKHYADLDKFVGEFKHQLDDSVFIIVSDHGYNWNDHEHSHHGFYSCSQSLKPKPKTIADFYAGLSRNSWSFNNE